MSVELLRYPTDDDWKRALMLARNTSGNDIDNVPTPSLEWKQKLIRSNHSPLRTLMFTVRMEIPYYVSVHFCRHKVGVEHYVRSQRSNPDRGAERQDTPVIHIMDMNASALLEIAGQRLCSKADKTTRAVMSKICYLVVNACPEFDPIRPKCKCDEANCPEFKPCGKYPNYPNNGGKWKKMKN